MTTLPYRGLSLPGLSLLSFILSTSCRQAPASQAAASAPADEAWLTAQQFQEAKIQTEAVTAHLVSNQITTSGKITFDDRHVAHVFSPVTGRVVRILADPGQRVRKGAALAFIESPDVGNAFADLGKAQADLIAADHDQRRQQELYEAHAGSQKELEQAQDNFGKAKAEMERAQQKARLFRAGSADEITQQFVLRAPIEGEIIARNVNPGAEVQGQYSGGTAVELFTVGELDHVWVQADVFELDLQRIKVGAGVTTSVVAYPNKTFQGTVDWISGALDPATRTARVRCSLSNTDRALKPEMYATIAIEVAGQKVPALPRAAILRISDQTVVFVQKPDSGGAGGAGAGDGSSAAGGLHFQRRVVAIDEDQGGNYVPILRGVTLGERVVTSGAILLSGML